MQRKTIEKNCKTINETKCKEREEKQIGRWLVGSHIIVERPTQRSNDKCVNVEFIDSWFVTIM